MRAWVSSFHQHVNSYAFSLEGVSNPRKEKARGFFTLTVFTQVFFLVVIYYMITRLFKWTHFTDLILNLHHIWFRIEDDSTNVVSVTVSTLKPMTFQSSDSLRFRSTVLHQSCCKICSRVSRSAGSRFRHWTIRSRHSVFRRELVSRDHVTLIVTCTKKTASEMWLI